MPVLTKTVGPRSPAIVNLYLMPTEAAAEIMRAEALPVPMPEPVAAMIDTGSAVSIAEQRTIDAVGVPQAGERSVIGVHRSAGAIPAATYRVRIWFGEGPGGDIASSFEVNAAEDLSHLGCQMILGRDFLARCTLIYNGHDGRFTFAY